LWRLWTERERLFREDLSDDDRAFAWRIVLFLLFPAINLLDMRATMTACEMLGGYVKNWSYGMLWYHAVPAGLSSQELIIPVLFAGSLTTTIFAICLLPSLFFRPHPFLATLIGYTIAFTMALNLIADPLLSAIGLGGLRWHIALTAGAADQRVPLLAVHAVLACIFLLVVRNQYFQIWFASLTRPYASAQLEQALATSRVVPENAQLCSLVGLLYDRSGLRRRAGAQLKRMKSQFPLSPYCQFLDAILSYRRRNYKQARKSFIYTGDYPGVDGELKASFLAAAACAAFADNDMTGALNLCERALEFDDRCVVARMVKVDVFLRQGKKEQAGDEILAAMHLDLDLNLEGRVPLDVDRAFNLLTAHQERVPVRHILQTSGLV
ncbi:MAG: tetratricopeptide repeat protein, partial [Terriglobales bacterium]